MGWPHRNERILMMNYIQQGHMGGWMGGGMWTWTVIGIVVIVLLVVLISKMSKK